MLTRFLTILGLVCCSLLSGTHSSYSQVVPSRLGDLDLDGEPTVLDLTRIINHINGNDLLGEDLIEFGDLNQDNFINGEDVDILVNAILGVQPLPELPLSTILNSSPTNGEDGVALTRETIITLTLPLNDDQVVTSEQLYAVAGGVRLDARIHVNEDRTRISLFYNNPLPPATLVQVHFEDGGLIDFLGRTLDLDANGNQGGQADISFTTLDLGSVQGTIVCGRVFASELLPGQIGGEPINVPLEGVTITVDGSEETFNTKTDAEGNFRLEPAPAGRFFVHIDGRTATAANGQPLVEGAYYPFVGKAWESTAGEEVNVGNIYLPLVVDGTLTDVSTETETIIDFPDEIVQEFPELEGVSLTVPPDSLFDNEGNRGGMVGIAPVDPERLPGELPDTLNFTLVITVQTDGATNFDEPVPVSFPNLPDPETGEVLAPGSKSALWSFNHDTGRFEVVGPMTVSEDGRFVVTDPGVGIIAPGWHGQRPGSQGGGGGTGTRDPNDPTRARSTGSQECARDDCPCPGTCSTRNSVYLHSGEEVFTRTDLFIQGRAGMNFEFTRTYRSQLDFNGPLGHGWNYDFNELLFIEPNGDVVRINGRSHIANWELQQDGSYDSPTGYFSKLERQNDGSFILHEFDGFKRYYRDDGRLFCREDRFGNRMLYDYDSFGNLSRVVDVYGREIDFFFETQSDGVDRLVMIRDFIGREIIYQYDARGDLVEVRAPVSIETPTGNDFPDGRTERYTYSSGFNSPELNHNLLSVTFPNEVASGGEARLRWTYGNDPSSPVNFDRVLSETEGGTNATGIAAGGAMTFVYEMMNEDEPAGQPDLARGKATITERNGNVKEYFVNEFNLHILTREKTKGLRDGEPEFHETRSFFDGDGQLIRRVFPRGNETLYTYDSDGPRSSQRNLIEVRRKAGSVDPDATDLVTRMTYEPLYNQLSTVIDPRGNADNFVPPLGDASAERYTTRYFYDYQESNVSVPRAQLFDLDLSTISRGLGDLNQDGRTDQVTGNLVRIESPNVILTPDSEEAKRLGAAIQNIVQEFQHNDFGQIVRVINQEGNVTSFDYHSERDPDGDGQPTHSAYVSLSNQKIGYPASVTVDADVSNRRNSALDPLKLVTTYLYDEVGNLTGVVDPRGIENQFVFNAYNEPVVMIQGSSIQRAAERGTRLIEDEAFQYRLEMRYDANGNVIKLSEENRDLAVGGIGGFHDKEYLFDILDNILEERHEVSFLKYLTTRYRYDPNELVIEKILPEGNRITYTYDERNLPFTMTRGAGADEASTTRTDYDGNMNRVAFFDAEDNSGDGQPDVTRFIYDGFDRVTQVNDRLGNKRSMTYDPVDNMINEILEGHLPGNDFDTTTRLFESNFAYDELNRMVSRQESLFISDGYEISEGRSVSLSDGNSNGSVDQTYEYDRLSRRVAFHEDDGQISKFTFDGADRLVSSTDPAGNSFNYTYDGNGNVVEASNTEVASDGSIPSETFRAWYVYDQIGRLVRATDSQGNTTREIYDSFNNIVLCSDAQGPTIDDPLNFVPIPINQTGNITRYKFDGIHRMVNRISELRRDGQGGGEIDISSSANPDGLVTESFIYDDNNRLTASLDDLNNRTSFEYDALDRITRKIYADGSTWAFAYDKDNNRTSVTDPNGTVSKRSYDALNRLLNIAVTPSEFTSGTVRQTFEYDGLGRVSRSEDTDDLGNVETVDYAYDSISRIIEEVQNGKPITREWFGDGRTKSIQYPNDRLIEFAHDKVDHITSINENGSSIYSANYQGADYRIIKRQLGNAVTTSFLNQEETGLTGYDEVRRITRLTHKSASSGQILSDTQYIYNRSGFRTSEIHHHRQGRTIDVKLDSLYRVINAVFEKTQAGLAPQLNVLETTYDYDGAGNRVATLTKTVSQDVEATYKVNSVNAYTQSGDDQYTYDRNGNLIGDETNTYKYDFMNRLTSVSSKETNSEIARYTYFADGRRSSRVVSSSTLNESIEYFYVGHQVVEERELDGPELVSYVYAPSWIDEPIQVATTANHPLGESTQYVLCNARQDVIGLTDTGGNLTESFLYDDFGNPSQLSTAIPYYFQGRRLDPETGWYYFRNRHYDPDTGRFVQRDAMDDPVNMGNVYTFAGSSPFDLNDPMGTRTRTRQRSSQTAPTRSGSLGGVSTWSIFAHGLDGVNSILGRYFGEIASKAFNEWKSLKPLASHLVKNARYNAALTQAYKAQSVAGGNSRLNSVVGNGAAFILGTVIEAQTSMNETYSGATTRSVGVGASNAALTANPYGAGFAAVSTLVDIGWDGLDRYTSLDLGKPPRVLEVYNNASRMLGVFVDGIAADDTYVDCRGRRRKNHAFQKSLTRLHDHMKNQQGSFTGLLLKRGEWWEKKVGISEGLASAYNFARGETFRGMGQEYRRSRMQGKGVLGSALSAIGF